MKRKEIEKKIKELETRSKWSKGITDYAIELLDNIEQGQEISEENLLNGAKDWHEYSWGGCSLIYDVDICKRLATPSEQKRTKNSEKKPNSKEEWLDTQARALCQASYRICRAAKNNNRIIMEG